MGQGSRVPLFASLYFCANEYFVLLVEEAAMSCKAVCSFVCLFVRARSDVITVVENDETDGHKHERNA